MNKTAIACVTIPSAAIVLSAAMLTAGPLDPPAGPIAPTYKTLTQVEPRIEINATNTPGDGNSLFRITQPGSYYLTGNITGVSAKHGIEIAGNDITIDLSGFTLDGVAGSQNGIVVTAAGANIIIRNGIVRDWGLGGIELYFSSLVQDSRIDGITASGNGGNGIRGGPNAIITNCLASGNTGNGIVIFANGSIDNCTSRANTGFGFSTGLAAIVRGCSARDNGGLGFEIGEVSTVDTCSAYANGNNGFICSGGVNLTHCTSIGNASQGFHCAGQTSITYCIANTNAGNGIRAGSSCLVLGNTCYANGTTDGAGINITGSDCRVEGNNVLNNDRGIDVDASGNVIVRNTASGNTTNYTLVANNVCFVVNATTAGAINGSSGGSSPGSTDPSVNFSY